MKKLILLLLVVFLVSGLSSCKKANMNVEEMQEAAFELNWNDVYSEFLSHEEVAIDEYDGKIVEWTGKIWEISDTYVTMASEDAYKDAKALPINTIDVYLDEEQMETVSFYDEISIVGKLNLSQNTTITNAYIIY